MTTQADFHQKNAIYSPANPYEKVKRLLDLEHGPKLKILELGSGNSLLGNFLQQLGHTVVGLDIHPPDTNPQFTFVVCDISQPWPADLGDFDLVICTDVAEHLYDPAEILNQAKKVLRPGGSLIFGVPNHFDLRQRFRMFFGRGIVHWDNVKDKQTAWQYAHIRFFNLADLNQLIQNQGWFAQTRQYNFMGGGIVPNRLTPKFIRKLLLRIWPGLFSGKFIFLLKPANISQPQKPSAIYIPNTPLGL